MITLLCQQLKCLRQIVEQLRLRRVCALAQTRQSLCCSHTQSIDVDVYSDQDLEI